MTRRLFLHVGLPKTGTTYLQEVLWANRDALRERRLLLPGERRTHLLASLDVREDPGLERRRGASAHPWRDLVDEVRAFDGDAVVSHEFFAAATSAQARAALDLLPDHEVHVLVTARATVDLFLSRWQEWVKNGGRSAIDDYPPDRLATKRWSEWGWPSFDLGIVLQEWGAVVPPARVHVLPVAPGRSDPADLWQRFASVLGTDPAVAVLPERPVNASLGLVEVELLRRVNAHLDDFRSAADRGTWIRGYLGEGEVLPRSSEKFRPGDAVLADLHERAARADHLLAEGGFDVVGDARSLVATDVADRRHPGEVDDAELLEVATRTVAAMLGDVRRARRPGAARQALPAAPRTASRMAPWQRLRATLRRRSQGRP